MFAYLFIFGCKAIFISYIDVILRKTISGASIYIIHVFEGKKTFRDLQENIWKASLVIHKNQFVLGTLGGFFVYSKTGQ